jgi:hypothetical protein
LPSLLLHTSAYQRETSQSQPQESEARWFRHGSSVICTCDDVVELVKWEVLAPAHRGDATEAGERERFGSKCHTIQRERSCYYPAPGDVTDKAYANYTIATELGKIDAV